MCGIFIVVSKNSEKLPKDFCIKTSKKLFNRGPDIFKFNFFRNDTVFISNTVLSITGKMEKSNNLSKSKNKRYSVSLNGEIYNYKDLAENYLKSKFFNKDVRDTDVLVNLYERINHDKIPKILNGMFAYAIYDSFLEKLIISNDVQGEKNLYYFNNKDLFILSSTIDVILEYIGEQKINKNILKNYFSTRHYMPITDTMFKGIKLFKPGTVNTFSLKKKNLTTKVYDDPISWITEDAYKKYKKYSEEEMIDFFDYNLKEQAKIMIPNKKFGCIVSGGVDSSLQAAIISQFKDPDRLCVVDHGPKDHIMKNIKFFNKYFLSNIKKLKMDMFEYQNLADKIYKIIASPLYTHDLPARLKLSNFFRNEKCKVFFSADGCDELYGGHQLYQNIFKGNYNYNLNHSPYSSNTNKYFATDELQNYLKKMWKKTFKKYDFIKSKREQNIQSSIFLDYFIQSIYVANRSNDLVCCNNSVEPRNIYISKNIIKILVNLPLHYKLDFSVKNKAMRSKIILKKLFCKYLDKGLVYKKMGFSGHPNSMKNDSNIYPLTKKLIGIDYKELNLNKKTYYDKKNFNRDMEWKLINIERFLNVFR